MKKIFLFLILSCFLATNVLTGWPLAAQAQETLPPPRDMSGIIEAAPESFDVEASAAEVLVCASGLYDFINTIISAVKWGACALFSTILGTDIGIKCKVSVGGTDTMQMCREWIQKKQAELKKYLAQMKKILIATYVRKLVDKMAFDIIDWISGKTTGEPQFITNFGDYLWQSANEAVGDVIEKSGTLSFLCEPMRARVVLELPMPQRPPLPICTIEKIMANIEDFYQDFRTGGWLAFNEVIKPQNNPYGAWLMEMERLDYEEARATEEAEKRSQSGFIPTEKCTLKVQEIKNGNPTGNYICLDTEVSIPGQTKADLTSKAASSQIEKAENYMITEADLLNYAKMIAEALISRIVKSAKEELIGGKYYGEGLLNVPETGDTNLGAYSCERINTVAMCVEDPDGTMTKAECDAACQPESYRCNRSGASPTCVADPNGTMTKAQCENSCTAAKYSCLDVYNTKMCALDPSGTYDTFDACQADCKVEKPPTCDNCTGVYVRGRYSYPYNNDPNNKDCSGNVCGKCSSVSPGTGACGAFCQNIVSSELWPTLGVPGTFGSDVLNQYEALFNKYGYAVPSSCTCNWAILGNQWASYGVSAGGGACRGCADLPIGHACSSVDWCDENCATPPPPPSCDNCHGVFVRGRYDPNSGQFSCNGDVCTTCTGVTPAGPCEAFCLNGKENLWGAPSIGLPDVKTFSKAEMEPYSALFSQFGFGIPDSCTCQHSMFTSASSYGSGYSAGYCRECVALPTPPGETEYFSACKKADWCDENCATPTPTPTPTP